MGCASGALPDYAPEIDVQETEADIATPDIYYKRCKRCGCTPTGWVGEHKTADDCIGQLRDVIAMMSFHPASNPGPKRRAASAR